AASADGEEFELNVVRVAKHQCGEWERLVSGSDAGVLDTEFVEPGCPGLQLLTRGDVETHVVQSRTGLVELLAAVAGVGVQPNQQTRTRVDEQHAVAGVLPFVVRKLHRHTVRAEHPLIPGHAALDVAHSHGKVVDSRDAGGVIVTHAWSFRGANTGTYTLSPSMSWRSKRTSTGRPMTTESGSQSTMFVAIRRSACSSSWTIAIA